MDLFESTLSRFLGFEHESDMMQLPMAYLLQAQGLSTSIRPLHVQFKCSTLAHLYKLDDEALAAAGLEAQQARSIASCTCAANHKPNPACGPAACCFWAGCICTANQCMLNFHPLICVTQFVFKLLFALSRAWVLVQRQRLRAALDWELLQVLLDELDAGYLAKRLAEKYAKEAASPALAKRGEAHPRITSLRDVHTMSKELLKELCGADAAAFENARSVVTKLRGLSVEERVAMVSRDFLSDSEHVRSLLLARSAFTAACICPASTIRHGLPIGSCAHSQCMCAREQCRAVQPHALWPRPSILPCTSLRAVLMTTTALRFCSRSRR